MLLVILSTRQALILKTKKIVHLISSVKRGGAETLLVDIVRGLPHYDHHVVFFHDGDNRQELEGLGCSVYPIKGLIFRYDVVFFLRLFFLLIKLRPDGMHTSLWMANFVGRLFARLLRIPFFSVIHLGIDQDGTIRNFLDEMTFSLSRKVIAVSDDIAHDIAKKEWISAARITVIKNGIDSAYIKRKALFEAKTRAELAIPEDVFIIGSVGRFIERKNYHLLLNSCKILYEKDPKIHVILVGFGPLEPILRLHAQKIGIDSIVSFVVGESAYGYYPLFDCFVLASLQEGISIALLEAMCLSLPCIVAWQEHKHAVIKNSVNGILVINPDDQNVAHALMRLKNNFHFRKKISKNAHQTIVESFSHMAMIADYKALFEKIS